jgi:hypothetical protein
MPALTHGAQLGPSTSRQRDDLPREIQHQLFEKAVVAGHHSERDEMRREQLDQV